MPVFAMRIDTPRAEEYTPGDKVGQEIDKEYKMIVEIIKKANLTFQ